MSKPAPPRDGVTVVIPAYNVADALDKALPAWGEVLSKLNRPFELIVVNDGSTDTTTDVLRKRASIPHLHVLTNDTRCGFGACLKSALVEAKQPLLLYAGVDYPYTPADIRQMLERIELRDEVLGKQPDLISGARAGQPRPTELRWLGIAWQWFWRIFSGLPIPEPTPWYGWDAWWYRTRASWVFGVPLADVNSAFKLWRVSFLKRVPIQSNGDFVHTELVAKATFLTSIMDEVPLTVKTDPTTGQPVALPALGPTSDDWWTVLRKPEFVVRAPEPTTPPPASTPTEPPKPDPNASAPPTATPPAPEQSAPAVSPEPVNAPIAPPASTPAPTQPTAEANAGGLSSPGSPVPAT
jgi:glycosyltransferase involved in cell wall biosynthesis